MKGKFNWPLFKRSVSFEEGNGAERTVIDNPCYHSECSVFSVLCRSCGCKVELLDGFCEPCRKVEKLMAECFTDELSNSHEGVF